MSLEKITFFDLPSKEPCNSWSLNPWKTRLLLNYKGLDYETKWVEYPDIKPTLQPHVKPNDTRWPFTIPAIKFPDGTWAQDSRVIADLIEARHPEPSAHLDSPYQARIEAVLPRAFRPLMAIGLNQIPRRLLNPPSVEYWVRDRTAVVGGDLAEHEAKNGGTAAFAAAAPGLQEVTAMLKENPDGPFFSGREVSYADFVWVAALYFFKRIGEDVYEGALEASGDRKVHEDILKAAEPWLKRCDY
ncbi:Thioredoxin-like protein [Cordyceps fumosorosea ARSEF 2679]|uniref:Thioredoxin-like protein n=1 Tax=Cordyceps fumosorosea (strain ARSEF 2679) TaxID=1081104 RepID=A0A168EET8_CORFA|nr:Thioredoxin-like protein [Cordyceps fumosorosea ARSEF 2679]OAA73727.1 Thioredoxin-like protein [Cordyceps fumosorosea ARSEF 2679]